jgi:hypothetical protein
MAIKYTIIFHAKASQNLPKLGFLVWNLKTIWQPWSRDPSWSGSSRIPSRSRQPQEMGVSRNGCVEPFLSDNVFCAKKNSHSRPLLFTEVRIEIRHCIVLHQGGQIFLGTIYQSGENIPNDYIITQNGQKIYPMVVKYSKWPEHIHISNLQSEILQNIRKSGFLVWK